MFNGASKFNFNCGTMPTSAPRLTYSLRRDCLLYAWLCPHLRRDRLDWLVNICAGTGLAGCAHICAGTDWLVNICAGTDGLDWLTGCAHICAGTAGLAVPTSFAGTDRLTVPTSVPGLPD
jgi:hypothetical protein